MKEKATGTIISIIASIVGFEEEDILLEDELRKDLGLEPEEFGDIISAIEREFQITITEEDRLGMITVDNIIGCVEEKKDEI